MEEVKEDVPNPVVQKQLVMEYIRQPMAIGQYWYLIDNEWYKRFKQYVGLEDNANTGVDHLGPKRFKQYVDLEDNSNAGVDHPGPIDNSPLLSQDHPGELREQMLDQLDYILVPEEAWKLLVQWYGVSSENTAIKRRVVNYGMFVKYCKVEVYPVHLRLCKDFDYNKELSYDFSISDPVRRIENIMRKLFEIPINVDSRVWSCFSANTFDLLTKPNSSIQDEGICPNQLMVIETRKEDGTWHRQSNMISSVLPTASTSSENRDAGDELFYSKTSSSRLGPGNSIITHENKVHLISKPGLCGLSNLGNTCFMNSMVQCMSNCPPIAHYFMRDEYRRELNVRNPLGMRGEIAKVFANLIKIMWSGNHTYTIPHQFKRQVGTFAPQFCGYQQHDSQELLTFLLDGLHEDLNRVINKPYIQTVHKISRTDEEMAAEAWKNYKKRNDSIIVDFFHGLLKSTVTCHDCNTISKTFDPFCYLSLPLPVMQDKSIDILLFPHAEELKPLKYTLELPNDGTIQDLVNSLAALRSANPRCFIATEVMNHHFHKIFTNGEPLESIHDKDCTYVYEMSLNYEHQLIIPVYMWESNENKLHANRLFGYPLLISVNKSHCTYNILCDIIWKKIYQYYCISGNAEEIVIKDKCPKQEYASLYDVEEYEGNSGASEYAFSLYLINKMAIRGEVIKIHNDNRPIQFPEMIGNSYIAAKWCPNDVQKLGFDIDFTEVVSKTKYSECKPLHLIDCLKLYTTSEMLGANNAWYCPTCKKHQPATKKIDLWRLPKILIMHLKRFSYSALRREKINTMVHFPLKGLSMSQFVIDKCHPKVSYDLIGVCNHYGQMGSGHYTAFCRNKIDKNWYLFDDIKISSVAQGDVVSDNAYVLFYMQHDETKDLT